MTALLRLENFNLMMLMSSFISLVFCSSKRFFCCKNDLLNTDTLLIKSLPVFPSESILTGFDCIEKLRWEHTIGDKLHYSNTSQRFVALCTMKIFVSII